MSFLDIMLGNLRGSGIVYLVCVAAIIGAFKLRPEHARTRQFTLLGAGLILAAGIGGGLLHAILYQVMVGATLTADFSQAGQVQKQIDALNTWAWVSGILSFLTGAAHAAGIASLVWAVFVDRMEMKAVKGVKRKPARRRRDDEDDEDDDEDEDDDRPRRRRR